MEWDEGMQPIIFKYANEYMVQGAEGCGGSGCGQVQGVSGEEECRGAQCADGCRVQWGTWCRGVQRGAEECRVQWGAGCRGVQGVEGYRVHGQTLTLVT